MFLCFALVPRIVDFYWYQYQIVVLKSVLTFWYRDNTTGKKNTTNLKRHLKAFHNDIEVSQDINVTLHFRKLMPTHEAVVNVSHFNVRFKR